MTTGCPASISTSRNGPRTTATRRRRSAALALAHAVAAIAIEEKLTGRFMIRSQTCTLGIDVFDGRACTKPGARNSTICYSAAAVRPTSPSTCLSRTASICDSYRCTGAQGGAGAGRAGAEDWVAPTNGIVLPPEAHPPVQGSQSVLIASYPCRYLVCELTCKRCLVANRISSDATYLSSWAAIMQRGRRPTHAL